jgi:hypothetical protein
VLLGYLTPPVIEDVCSDDPRQPALASTDCSVVDGAVRPSANPGVCAPFEQRGHHVDVTAPGVRQQHRPGASRGSIRRTWSSWRTIASIAVTVPSQLALGRPSAQPSRRVSLITYDRVQAGPRLAEDGYRIRRSPGGHLLSVHVRTGGWLARVMQVSAKVGGADPVGVSGRPLHELDPISVRAGEPRGARAARASGTVLRFRLQPTSRYSGDGRPPISRGSGVNGSPTSGDSTRAEGRVITRDFRKRTLSEHSNEPMAEMLVD